MNRRTPLAMTLVGLLAISALLAPAVDAGSRPIYMFLRDASLPPVDGRPACSPAPSGSSVGDGELTVQPPCPLNVAAPENNSAPQSRVVFPAVQQVHPTQFVMLNQSLNTGQIYGPVIVLLYVPETPAVQSGNLSVQLVALPKTYSAADVGATGDVLAEATIDLAYHNTTTPEPSSLIPPDPTNVTAASSYIEGQLLVYGFTELSKAQYIMFLDDAVKDKIINKVIDKDAKLALRFSLVPSIKPAPIPLGLPVAQGAGQPIFYNFALTPALVYVPWFSSDPNVVPKPQATPPPPQPCSGCSSSSSPDDGSSTTGTQKSGAPEAVFVLAVLACVLFVRRRGM